MTGLVLLVLAWQFSDLSGRTFPRLSLVKLATTASPRAEVCGPVVYVRKQQDRDWHITLDDGTRKVVLEIIPELPLPVPKKGHTIRARGVVRFDRRHGWPELHPLLAWVAVQRC